LRASATYDNDGDEDLYISGVHKAATSCCSRTAATGTFARPEGAREASCAID
jgi:hypothetical protein